MRLPHARAELDERGERLEVALHAGEREGLVEFLETPLFRRAARRVRLSRAFTG
jgi:hypothetical protein